jgi:hypothetical protein
MESQLSEEPVKGSRTASGCVVTQTCGVVLGMVS